MTDELLPDPQLQSFEAQLAIRAPQVSSEEKESLLYACAFAAGQSQASRSLQRWKVSTAALGVALVALTIPHLSNSSPMAQRSIDVPHSINAQHSTKPWQSIDADRPIEQSVPAERAKPLTPLPMNAMVSQRPVAATLDAWQVREPSDELGHQMAQLEQVSPHLRSLTVGTLTRAALNP